MLSDPDMIASLLVSEDGWPDPSFAGVPVVQSMSILYPLLPKQGFSDDCPSSDGAEGRGRYSEPLRAKYSGLVKWFLSCWPWLWCLLWWVWSGGFGLERVQKSLFE